MRAGTKDASPSLQCTALIDIRQAGRRPNKLYVERERIIYSKKEVTIKVYTSAACIESIRRFET
jgi:hypothetical protein